MPAFSRRCSTALCWCLIVPCLIGSAKASDAQADALAIQFTQETLDNGLKVIYAPLHHAPVVHVRMLYHVGSRDERPDRQGFAHMFEHMMFRGSAHVAPEQHMKLVMQVGGDCNAFTSYDQTTYENTVPATNLEMVLYLEADRMASFKVSDEIFGTERKVVSEEWRMRYGNQPYGALFGDFVKTAYVAHPYRWTTVGDMDQLKSATSGELQQFFNKYYVPNNACLVIAGDIDPAATSRWVHRYFGWIPRGADVSREIPAEPQQTEPRRLEVSKRDIPLATVMLGYKTTTYTDHDHYALSILGHILGDGESSRLEKLLINGPNPLCNAAGAGDQQLEDLSLFICRASALPGKNPADVEKAILDAIADINFNGVTEQELAKAKTQARMNLIQERATAQSLATTLAQEAVFGHDAARANLAWQNITSLTPVDIQSVARKYLQPAGLTVLHYLPDPLGLKSVTSPADIGAKAADVAAAAVAPSTGPVTARTVAFPADYPAEPPLVAPTVARPFEKGVEFPAGNGVKVIVMPDARLPMVNWTLTMRAGSDAEPSGKQGLSALTAAMLRRGAGDLNYLQLSDDLDSRGISIDASDAGDNTRISGSCMTEQLDHAIQRTREILLTPKFAEAEFTKLKFQSAAGLMRALSSPSVVAGREMGSAMFGESPLGRQMTVQSLKSITLNDAKEWYRRVYKPNDAILLISGDVTAQRGKEIADKLLAGWERATDLPTADYSLPPPATSRRIVLVDNPQGKQSTIRLAVRAFDIHSDEKFAGFAAGRILSDGIHARFDRYVRAEKGYTYGSSGEFEPGRHGGLFVASVDTNPQTTVACIEAMFKVLADMRAENVTPEELAQAKTRVAGSMAMQMQTIVQQAQRRIDGILNDYPPDYYDNYPRRIAAVTAEQIRLLMSKYVRDDLMTIVVVAPADEVKQQLETLGQVKVIPMPAQRTTIENVIGKKSSSAD
jgi:zinc protease